MKVVYLSICQKFCRMDPKAIISRISSLKNPNTPPKEVSDILRFIRHDINDSFVKQNFRHRRKSFFHEIFDSILFIYDSGATDFRYVASKAFGSFLYKIIPIYTDEIIEIFTEYTYDVKKESMKSGLIISVFMLISNYLSPAALNNYVQSIPIIDHFTNVDFLPAENISNIIKHLGPLTDDWYEQLLGALLHKVANFVNQQLSTFIVSIIAKNPGRFLKFTFSQLFEKSELSHHLPLILYIINVIGTDVYVDLYPAAAAAVEILNLSKDATSASIDSALQILSIITYSFRVEIEPKDQNLLITVLNSKTNAFVEINPAQFQTMTSFYGLPLPLNYILPQEKDSNIIIAAKLKSLAKQAAFAAKCPDVTQTMQIFEKFIRGENGFIISSATEYLSYFVNRVAYNLPLMQKAILGKINSWLHGVSIISVIEQLDFSLLPRCMIKDICARVVEFSFDKSNKLSDKAINSLSKVVNSLTYDYIMENFMKKFDPFDGFSILRGCSFLKKFLKLQFPIKESIETFGAVMVDALELHADSTLILAEILNFISKFRILGVHNQEKATLYALYLVDCYLSYFTGQLLFKSYYSEKIGKDNINLLKESSTNVIESFDTDITLGRKCREILNPIKYALRFLLKPKLDTNIVKHIVFNLFKFIPDPISEYFANYWGQIPISLGSEILETLSLNNVSEISVFSNFAFVFINSVGATYNPKFTEITRQMHENIRFILRENLVVDVIYSTNLAYLILKSFYDSVNDVKIYLKRIHPSEQVIFLTTLSRIFGDVYEVFSDVAGETIKDLKCLPYIIRKDKELKPREIETNFEIIDENSAVRAFINSAFAENNYSLINSMKKLDKFNIDFTQFDVPESSIKVISHYVSLNNPLRLTDPLSKVRTAWKSSALSAMRKIGNSIIEKLIITPKITKETIKDIMFCLQFIKFDTTKLLALAVRTCFEALKPKRKFIAFRFLAAVVNYCPTVPAETADQFLDAYETMEPPFEEAARVVVSLSRKISLSQRLLVFAAKLVNIKQSFPIVSLVLCSMPCSDANIKFFAQEINDLLSYNVPSKFNATMRIATQACLFIKTQNASNIILPVFNYSTDYVKTRNAIINQSVTNFFSHAILRYDLQDIRVNLGRIVQSSNSHLAYSMTFCGIYPSFMKSFAKDSNIYKTVFSFGISLFSCPCALSSSLFFLHEAIRGDDPSRQQAVVSQCMKDFVSQPFFRSLPKSVDMWKKFLQNNFTPVYTAALISQIFIPLAPFHEVLASLYSIYAKSNFDSSVAATIVLCQQRLTEKIHKDAINILLQRGDMKQALKLSLYDTDAEYLKYNPIDQQQNNNNQPNTINQENVAKQSNDSLDGANSIVIEQETTNTTEVKESVSSNEENPIVVDQEKPKTLENSEKQSNVSNDEDEPAENSQLKNETPKASDATENVSQQSKVSSSEVNPAENEQETPKTEKINEDLAQEEISENGEASNTTDNTLISSQDNQNESKAQQESPKSSENDQKQNEPEDINEQKNHEESKVADK